LIWSSKLENKTFVCLKYITKTTGNFNRKTASHFYINAKSKAHRLNSGDSNKQARMLNMKFHFPLTNSHFLFAYVKGGKPIEEITE